MNCGTVFYDEKFQFGNGLIIDKLVIVLSSYGDNWLAVTATTKQKAKNKIAGCQLKDIPPNFFLPKGSSWFTEDSWIELSEVSEIQFDIHEIKKADGVVRLRTVLSSSLMKELLSCAIKSKDIDGFDREFLQAAYDQL